MCPLRRLLIVCAVTIGLCSTWTEPASAGKSAPSILAAKKKAAPRKAPPKRHVVTAKPKQPPKAPPKRSAAPKAPKTPGAAAISQRSPAKSQTKSNSTAKAKNPTGAVAKAKRKNNAVKGITSQGESSTKAKGKGKVSSEPVAEAQTASRDKVKTKLPTQTLTEKWKEVEDELGDKPTLFNAAEYPRNPKQTETVSTHGNGATETAFIPNNSFGAVRTRVIRGEDGMIDVVKYKHDEVTEWLQVYPNNGWKYENKDGTVIKKNRKGETTFPVTPAPASPANDGKRKVISVDRPWEFTDRTDIPKPDAGWSGWSWNDPKGNKVPENSLGPDGRPLKDFKSLDDMVNHFRNPGNGQSAANDAGNQELGSGSASGGTNGNSDGGGSGSGSNSGSDQGGGYVDDGTAPANGSGDDGTGGDEPPAPMDGGYHDPEPDDTADNPGDDTNDNHDDPEPADDDEEPASDVGPDDGGDAGGDDAGGDDAGGGGGGTGGQGPPEGLEFPDDDAPADPPKSDGFEPAPGGHGDDHDDGSRDTTDDGSGGDDKEDDDEEDASTSDNPDAGYTPSDPDQAPVPRDPATTSALNRALKGRVFGGNGNNTTPTDDDADNNGKGNALIGNLGPTKQVRTKEDLIGMPRQDQSGAPTMSVDSRPGEPNQEQILPTPDAADPIPSQNAGPPIENQTDSLGNDGSGQQQPGGATGGPASSGTQSQSGSASSSSKSAVRGAHRSGPSGAAVERMLKQMSRRSRIAPSG